MIIRSFPGPDRQAGLGTLGFLAILAVVAIAALAVMRILPMYLDYFSVVTSLEGLQEDPRTREMGPIEIRQAAAKRFDINNVSGLRAQDLKIKRDGSVTTVRAVYEVRRPLVANLDIVASFDKSVELDSR